MKIVGSGSARIRQTFVQLNRMANCKDSNCYFVLEIGHWKTCSSNLDWKEVETENIYYLMVVCQ